MIVDDHPIVRDGLTALLAGHPNLSVCAQAEDIDGAMRELVTNHIDLAIVDISLRGENGLDLIHRIQEMNKAVRILVVSMHDESLFGARALAAGARGFLNKQTAGRNIVDAICQILDGKKYFSDDLMEQRLPDDDVDDQQSAPIAVSSLTDRELSVFRCIGAGLTTTQIAKNLHVSIKTIESHRQNIKRKLRLQNGAMLSREAAQWVLLNQ